MIQRKQTVFLLLAVIVSICCLCMPIAELVPKTMSAPSQMYNLWIVDGDGNHDFSTWPLFAILLITAAIALIAIFQFKKRIQQARLCLINIFLLVAWYIVFAFYAFSTLEQDGMSLSYGIPLALPAVSIILNFMARHGILADEKLVRSMDRIR